MTLKAAHFGGNYMGAFLGATGMVVGILGGICWLVYSSIKHRSKRKPLVLIGIGTVFFVVGVSITPSSNDSEKTTPSHLSKQGTVLVDLKNSYHDEYQKSVDVTYNKYTKAFEIRVYDKRILNDLDKKLNDSNEPTPDLDKLLDKMKQSSNCVDDKFGKYKHSIQLKSNNDDTVTYYIAYQGKLENNGKIKKQ